MITKITGRDFKGLTFSQPLGRLNLFIGPNGSGKSARTQSLILAVTGYIPGGAKKNAEILGTYGTEDTMVIGFETEGVLLSRGFVRSSSGTVSQWYKMAVVPAKEGEFLKAMAKYGDPKIVDISAFMDLSDQKKIDAVFSLYPPAGDITKIQAEIDSAREKTNTLMARSRTSEAAAARLVAAKPPLPAGTLADVTGKIVETAESLRLARQALVDAQVAEGARLAKEKAEKKAAEEAEKLAKKQKEDADRKAAADLFDAEQKRLKDEAARKERERIAEEKKNAETIFDSLVEKPGPMEAMVDKKFGKYDMPVENLLSVPPVPQDLLVAKTACGASIELILLALKAAGCEACAAKLVATRELRKYQEVKS